MRTQTEIQDRLRAAKARRDACKQQVMDMIAGKSGLGFLDENWNKACIGWAEAQSSIDELQWVMEVEA